jgi:hypothetical protein
VGASCDDLSASCATGLYCSMQTSTCAPLQTAGAPCGEGGGDPGGCEAPLGCGDPPSTCSSGSAGAACVTDQQCAPGLGCVPVGPCASGGEVARIGCSPSGQCIAVGWPAAGQSCNDAFRCLVGSCGSENGLVPIPSQGNDGGLVAATCPKVVPDGQPCSASSTCDTFAECFQGRCILLDAVACK